MQLLQHPPGPSAEVLQAFRDLHGDGDQVEGGREGQRGGGRRLRDVLGQLQGGKMLMLRMRLNSERKGRETTPIPRHHGDAGSLVISSPAVGTT